jgi:hypothetical protein
LADSRAIADFQLPIADWSFGKHGNGDFQQLTIGNWQWAIAND